METTAEIAPHPSRDAWTSHLRSHGRRVTKQRLAVLDAVSAVPHATAEDTVQQVRSVLPNMSVQPVYVVLADLAAIGMATSAPSRPISVPPTSAPMTTSDPGTEIALFMTRGVSTYASSCM